MTKESSEGELLKKKVLITTGKGLKNYRRQNAVNEKVIYLDQLEFLPIFPLLRTFNLDAASTESNRSFLF